jgi:hypothetical protein
MRNTLTFATAVRHLVCLALLSSSFSTIAAPAWYSLGLDDRAVHCILADDTSKIIAGTDSGVSVRTGNAKWFHIKMLPVRALERVSSTAVAAAAGNGSKSDGIYIGQDIINGPPFYSFTLGQYLANPSVLTAEQIVTIAAAPGPTAILYAGNSNSVVSGLVSNDSLKTLKPIGIPAYAFGVEMPYCSSLHLFSGQLFAGGYDISPAPGLSYLLHLSDALSGDTMYTMRKMKATAISEGRFSSILGSSSLVMVIADADSGIFFYNQSMSNPWRRIAGPTSNPIQSLYVLSGPVNDNTLYAANKDGVYETGIRGTIQASMANWSEIGNLPVEPHYITRLGLGSDLVAGTVKGLYRYGENTTDVLNTPRTSVGKSVYGRKKLTVAVTIKPDARRTGFDIKGRIVAHPHASGVSIIKTTF